MMELSFDTSQLKVESSKLLADNFESALFAATEEVKSKSVGEF